MHAYFPEILKLEKDQKCLEKFRKRVSNVLETSEVLATTDAEFHLKYDLTQFLK